MSTYNPSTFFQIAAGVIPALLVGGYAIDQLRPVGQSPTSSARRRGWLVLCPVPLIVVAEFFALVGALGFMPGTFPTALVALILLGMTVLGIFSLGWKSAISHLPKFQKVAYGLATMLLVVYSAYALASSVESANEIKRFDNLPLAELFGSTEEADQFMRLQEDQIRARLMIGELTEERAGKQLLQAARVREKILLTGIDISRLEAEREAGLRTPSTDD